MNALTSKALTRPFKSYLKFEQGSISLSYLLHISLHFCQSNIQSVLFGQKQTSSYVLFKSVSRLEYSSWSLCFSFASSVFFFNYIFKKNILYFVNTHISFFVDIARKYFHQHNIHTNCMTCLGSKGRPFCILLGVSVFPWLALLYMYVYIYTYTYIYIYIYIYYIFIHTHIYTYVHIYMSALIAFLLILTAKMAIIIISIQISCTYPLPSRPYIAWYL